ncbi:hypothetical protein PLESTF_000189400 [Pleodorina starrii]|nr:hypothetical protein PLESTF_000189400 [Pleodorina starrii]
MSDAITQTDPPPSAVPRAASPPSFSSHAATPHTKPHGVRGRLFDTPGCVASTSTPVHTGVVEAAVQQACRSLLTPHQSSAAKALASRPGGFAPQNTPIPDSMAKTPAAGRASRLRSHHPETPLSELSLAPFSGYQHVQQMQEAQQSCDKQPADDTAAAETPLWPIDYSGAAAQQRGSCEGAASCATEPVASCPERSAVSVGASIQAAAASASAPGAASSAAAAAAELAEPSFTPNTTTVRLRAAMQWMQLQLQVSPCHVSRPRRYSDSSVSPALKILAPNCEPAATQPALGVPAPAPGAAAVHDGVTPSGGLFDRWEVAGKAEPAAASWQGSAAAAVQAPATSTAVKPFAAAPPPSVSASGPARPSATVGAAGQPDWPQPLVGQSAVAAPAVPKPHGVVTAAAAAVGSPPAAGQSQPQTAEADPWVGGAPVMGPLRDISGSVGNAPRPQPQPRGQQKKQSGSDQVQRSGAGPKDETKAEAALQQRPSSLRFSLRW